MDSLRIASISNTLATISFDLQGYIKESNTLFCETMGYSVEELRGKHHRIFCAQEYVKSVEYKEFWEKLRRGESYSDDCLRFKKNGDEIWLRAIYIPVKSGADEIAEIFKIAYEVTTRLMEEVDSRSQLIAINKSQARIEFDLNGIVLAANENFLATTGYSLKEIVGKHHRMFCPPDYAASDEYKKFWQDLNDEESFTGDFLRKTKDGKDLWLRASYSPVYDVRGKLAKIVKFAWDITEEQLTKIKVISSLKTTAGSLSQDSNSLTQSGQHLKLNAEETREKIRELRDTLQTTSESIKTVAGAMTELDSCIAQIAENAAGAARLSLDAVSETNKSNEDVKSLKENVISIAEVVQSIDKIAANTNLLALNATIEASRAGESGRGFSVVAQEVKTLSNQTQQATQNIDTTVNSIQERTELVSTRISSVLKIVDLLNQIATSTASSVDEQSATTQEVKKSTNKILNMAQLSQQKILQTEALADENLQIASALENASQECNSLSGQLQEIVTSLSEL